jgi:hypothetical protein
MNTELMKLVYYYAAEHIATDVHRRFPFGYGCCNALYTLERMVLAGKEFKLPIGKRRDYFNAVCEARRDCQKHFTKFFRPRAARTFWFGHLFTREEQESRALALLFARELL